MSESSGPLPLRVATVSDDADRAALERIARDELGALDDLYERYKTMAYSIAYRITNDATTWPRMWSRSVPRCVAERDPGTCRVGAA
jgi:hypothetical protein